MLANMLAGLGVYHPFLAWYHNTVLSNICIICSPPGANWSGELGRSGRLFISLTQWNWYWHFITMYSFQCDGERTSKWNCSGWSSRNGVRFLNDAVFRMDPHLYHKFENMVISWSETYVNFVTQETRISRKLFIFSSKRSKSTMQKVGFLIIELWLSISTFLMKKLKK